MNFTYFLKNLWTKCLSRAKATSVIEIGDIGRTNRQILVVVLLYVLLFIYFSLPLDAVECVEPLKAFKERQNNLRVEILLEAINKVASVEDLVAINKCIKSCITYPYHEGHTVTDISVPNNLIASEPFKFKPFIGHLLFFLLFVFLSIVFDGALYFSTLMLVNPQAYQELVLSNLTSIINDYDAVERLYDSLVSLKVIKD